MTPPILERCICKIVDVHEKRAWRCAPPTDTNNVHSILHSSTSIQSFPPCCLTAHLRTICRLPIGSSPRLLTATHFFSRIYHTTPFSTCTNLHPESILYTATIHNARNFISPQYFIFHHTHSHIKSCQALYPHLVLYLHQYYTQFIYFLSSFFRYKNLHYHFSTSRTTTFQRRQLHHRLSFRRNLHRPPPHWLTHPHPHTITDLVLTELPFGPATQTRPIPSLRQK